jgi:hypothetical protein
MVTSVKAGGVAAERLSPFTRRFPAGAVIFKQNDPGHDMFILQKGQVEIFQTIGGEKRRLAILEKGDFFGEMALLEDYPERSATALAVSAVEVLQLRGADFEELVQTKPNVALKMMAKLSERLRESNRRLAESVQKPASPTALPPLPTSQGIESWAVLYHETGGRVFPLRPVGDTTLGRHDPVTGVTPDVDLSSLDPDRTVSRRHGVIRAQEGGFTLTEVNKSTNGTFVDGERLEAFKPHALTDGCIVQLAMVTLRLRILAPGG